MVKKNRNTSYKIIYRLYSINYLNLNFIIILTMKLKLKNIFLYNINRLQCLQSAAQISPPGSSILLNGQKKSAAKQLLASHSSSAETSMWRDILKRRGNPYSINYQALYRVATLIASGTVITLTIGSSAEKPQRLWSYKLLLLI